MNINNLIKTSSNETPDPPRALKNLQRLLEKSPEFIEKHNEQIYYIARLFSYSQFLADYSINNPNMLSFALKNINEAITKKKIILDSSTEYLEITKKPHVTFKKEILRFLRELKKRYLLIITMRDVCGLIDLYGCMSELTSLAEAIMELTLDASFIIMKEKFGDIKDRSYCIIGFGKLGAHELNYSSDIDIIAVYRSKEYISSGITSQTGLRINRIESHEYFCRLTELFSSLLNIATEDGIAYRVDTRLRPNGQKGDICLSLKSYSSYYEAWGKTWERMALIRARPITGDLLLGNLFIVEVEPFVWKRAIDFNDIDEIREMKNKIDTVYDLNDIKRSYGGIREIEFFVQIFQLLYGGEKSTLRSTKLTDALDGLYKEGILTKEDIERLSEGYSFLRKLEHILQMKEDLQTHTLPTDPDELAILSRKFNFSNVNEFLIELKLKRLIIRDMYNSLLGPSDEKDEVILTLDKYLPENAVLDYLSFKGFKNPESALKHIKSINEYINSNKTMRERNHLKKAIFLSLQHILQNVNKDTALSKFLTFIQKLGNIDGYIDLLLQRKDANETVINILSSSNYLTRLLLSLDNIEALFEYPELRIDYKSLEERLNNIINLCADPLIAIREFKLENEFKAGILFLQGFTGVIAFTKTLSKLADTILKVLIRYLKVDSDFAVVGLGGFGAMELNIGSDLDMLFISTKESHYSKAENIIRFLSEYTPKGMAYNVDMRLRPDGSKGILLNNLKAYETYYQKSAHLWEIQSLLRARPIAGDNILLRNFENMRKKIIMCRGVEITGSYVKDMRKKIIKEIREKPFSYDIKKGIGGIKEIEFLVQYLQMKNSALYPDIIVPNTKVAIKTLLNLGVIDIDTEARLSESYIFLRTVETLLRLNDMDVLKINSDITDIIISFMKLKNRDELVKKLDDIKCNIIKITEKYYC